MRQLAKRMTAGPMAMEVVRVEMKLAAWMMAIERLLGEVVIAQVGWRFERWEGDGRMARLVAAWKATLRAMIGYTKAATEVG
jgi:hypothetical protein